MVGTRCSWNKILYSVENMLKTMFLQYYTKSLIMFYINENFICLYRNDSNRVTWNLKTDVFTNKNSISRIEKWYSGNVYVNGHASYNIHMIGFLLLRHFPVSIYIWYVIHVCDRTDSWRTLNMTMCLILKTNRREMLKTIPRQMMQTPKTVIYSTLNEQTRQKND